MGLPLNLLTFYSYNNAMYKIQTKEFKMQSLQQTVYCCHFFTVSHLEKCYFIYLCITLVTIIKTGTQTNINV